MRRLRRLMPLVGCLLLVALQAPVGARATASAAPDADRPGQRVLTVGEEFLPADLTIRSGGRLTLTNLEPAPHDVVSTVRRNGVPLFRSRIVTAGGSAVVEGVAALGPGAYTFICSVHPAMQGVLEVTAP